VGDFDPATGGGFSSGHPGSPNYSNAYVAIGFAHSILGDPEKAKEDFHRALEIDPLLNIGMTASSGS
jgi:tetratricopeptide (TPR) repeat protein